MPQRPAARRLMLAALLATPTDAANQLWTAPTKRVSSSEPRDAYQGLDMRCVGDEGRVHKACLMRDLYYDTASKTFLFFGRKIDPDFENEDDAEIKRRFGELMDHVAPLTATGEFSMEWSAAERPADTDTCVVSVPIHLRQEYPTGTRSIGHLFRDNFHALVAIPLQLGLSASHFSWAAWPRTEGNHHGQLSHVQEKYTDWLSIHKTFTWQQLVAACRNGELGARDASRPPRKPRYVHLENALASGEGANWTLGGSKSNVCARAHFREQRDLAYRLNGVPVVPVATQERVLVTFMWKEPRDKRRMLLESGLLDAVRARYPQVDVEVHAGIEEAADAQLSWLSRTAIFITNIGSPSFRLLYLSDGAQVIMVGGLETAAEGSDGKMHKVPGSPDLQFREIETCWKHLDYLTFHRYHVRDPRDLTFLKKMRRSGPVYQPGRDWEAVRIRDAHVTVRTEQLLPLIDDALENVQRARDESEVQLS